MALRYITETAAGTRALGSYSFAVIPEVGAQQVSVAGQLGVTSEGVLLEGIGPQTEQAMRNIQDILGEVATGMGLERIGMIYVRLADTALFGEFNAAYAQQLGDGPYPAREAIEVGIPVEGALVELTAIAWLPPSEAGGYIDTSYSG